MRAPSAIQSTVAGNDWVVQTSLANGTAIDVYSAEGTKLATASTADVGRYPTNPTGHPMDRCSRLSTNDGRDDLWLVDADGTNAKRVYDCVAPCDLLDDPAWAPDGKSIAACEFSAESTDHVGSLVTVDVATGSLTTLYKPPGDDFCAGPRWSPDGDAIVLEIVHREDSTIDSAITGVTLSIVDLSARPVTVRKLTDPALFAATADWSRDGSLIVYSALANHGDPNPDLFTIHPDGSALTRLTELSGQGGAAEPGFDLSGQSVVFVAAAGGLKLVDLATGAVTQAFINRVDGRHPRARPGP